MRESRAQALARPGWAGEVGGNATVVVFEDVDMLADEDRGFLSALAGLITETKVCSCCCNVV